MSQTRDIRGIDTTGPVALISGADRMTAPSKEPDTSSSREFVKQSSLYQEFLAEREEILKAVARVNN